MKKLWCESLMGFRHLCEINGWDKNVPNDIAIISIIGSEECKDDEEIHLCSGENVLNLEFDDCSPQALNLDENTEIYKYKSADRVVTLHFFTDEMAKKSIEFINRNLDKDIYVHCYAGVSRSQAFISFIQQYYTQNEWETNPNNPCVCPNYFVKSKLVKNM